MARLFGSIKNINKVAAYKDGKRASLRQLAWLWTVALEFTDPLVLAAWRAAAFHPSVNWSKGPGPGCTGVSPRFKKFRYRLNSLSVYCHAPHTY